MGEALGDDGADQLCRFVYNGGGYYGSCCGAFLASRCGYMPCRQQYTMLGVNPFEFTAGIGMAKCALLPSAEGVLHSATESTELSIEILYQNGQTFGQATDS